MCNSVGSLIETKYINIEPVNLAMNKTHIIIASDDIIYVWQYQMSGRHSSNKKVSRENIFHIDEVPNMNIMYDFSKY